MFFQSHMCIKENSRSFLDQKFSCFIQEKYSYFHEIKTNKHCQVINDENNYMQKRTLATRGDEHIRPKMITEL